MRSASWGGLGRFVDSLWRNGNDLMTLVTTCCCAISVLDNSSFDDPWMIIRNRRTISTLTYP
jgi:hypothetical protein